MRSSYPAISTRMTTLAPVVPAAGCEAAGIAKVPDRQTDSGSLTPVIEVSRWIKEAESRAYKCC
jgi:hypothetical protein